MLQVTGGAGLYLPVVSCVVEIDGLATERSCSRADRPPIPRAAEGFEALNVVWQLGV
jgi:hypothetical protein